MSVLFLVSPFVFFWKWWVFFNVLSQWSVKNYSLAQVSIIVCWSILHRWCRMGLHRSFHKSNFHWANWLELGEKSSILVMSWCMFWLWHCFNETVTNRSMIQYSYFLQLIVVCILAWIQSYLCYPPLASKLEQCSFDAYWVS